jgi:hypothetical protein
MNIYFFYCPRRDAQIAPALVSATAPRQFLGCPRRDAFPLSQPRYNVNHDISKRYSDHPQQTENFDVAKNMHFITLK